MAATVSAVPNPDFAPAPLVTTSQTVVNRKDIELNCNFPTTYSHNGQTNYPSTVTYDIADAENLLDLRRMWFKLPFVPQFYRHSNSALVDYGYARGTGPQLDQSTQSLLARVTISTSQGMTYEDLFEYGLFSNMMMAQTESIQHKANDLRSNSSLGTAHNDTYGEGREALDVNEEIMNSKSRLTETASSETASSIMTSNDWANDSSTATRTIYLKLLNSSFLNNIQMLPLFLLKNGLRIVIEFQNPKFCFYNNYLGAPASYKIPINRATMVGTFYPCPFSSPSTVTENHLGPLYYFKEEALPFPLPPLAGGDTSYDGVSDDAKASTPFISWAAGTVKQTTVFSAATVQDTLITPVNWMVRFYYRGRPCVSAQTGVPHPFYKVRALSRIKANITTGTGAPLSTSGAWYANPSYLNGITAPNTGYPMAVQAQKGCVVFWLEGPYRTCDATTAAASTAANNVPLFQSTGAAGSTLGYGVLVGGTPTLPVNYVSANQGTWANSMFSPTDIMAMADEMRIYTSINGIPDYTGYRGKSSVTGASFPTGTLVTPKRLLTSMVPHTPVTGITDVNWNYQVINPTIVATMVKPAGEVLAAYRNQFLAPAGIQYKYVRYPYYTQTLPAGQTGQVDFTIPFAVRSLRNIFVVITDPACTQSTTDNTIYNFPSKSSWMMRGLDQVRLQIGAQTFPSYQIMFRSESVVEHLQSLDNCFTAVVNNNAVANYVPAKLDKNSRDYLACTGVCGWSSYQPLASDAPVTMVNSNGDTTTSDSNAAYNSGSGAATTPFDGAFAPQNGTYDSTMIANTGNFYRDTSRFLLGFSLQKKDGDFTSGVDTSQAGAVNLSLTFKAFSANRPKQIHIFGAADAIVTFQADGHAVRF